MSKELLLIDAATTKVLAAVFSCESGIVSLEEVSGHVVDSLFAAIDKILTENNCELSDFDGIVFCGGPGSTLGIRTELMFVRTILGLIKKDLSIYRYSTFDMAFALNPDAKNVALSYSNCKFLVKSRSGDVTKIVEKNEAEALTNAVFLQTKRIPCDISLPIAQYDLRLISGNIFDLVKKVKSVDQIIYNDSDTTFVKWSSAAKPLTNKTF